MRRLRLILAAVLAGLGAGAAAELPVERATVARSFPHDPVAFTEGLFFRNGRLFESTGLEGASTVREVRLADGKVLRSIALPPSVFGEGIIDWKDEIIGVTWRGGTGTRWSIAGFRAKGEVRYTGEGWGLARIGAELVLSDGTPILRFLDPDTFAERRRITVTAEGSMVRNLNELEYVNGDILANIWMTDVIARIDPATGMVKGWIDLSALPRPKGATVNDNVANGIAWDARGRRLFVTGKNWDRLYEVHLTRN